MSDAIVTVNGHPRTLHPERTLLEALREDLGLTGTKLGCGEGECGACTVLVDGAATRACVTPVADVAGRSVTTIEGLAPEGARSLHRVQRAFLEERAMQCGYCTPGMVMSAVALLRSESNPTRDRIVEAMNGNVCRCCAYPRILAAIERAARSGVASSDEAPDQAPDEAPDPRPRPVPDPVPSVASRPATPWDLTEADARDWFEILPRGLVAVLPPDTVDDVWSAPGGAWIHVGEDGTITAFTGKVDVGQDNRTALSQRVAEELDAPLGDVRLVMGDTDVCPWDMGTFGSRSMADAGPVLAAAAAGTRELLVQLASERLEADPADLTVDGGRIAVTGTGRGASFGELVQGLRRVETIGSPPDPTDPARWRTAGTPATARHLRDAVTGARTFPSDVIRPGMLYEAVLRPPAHGSAPPLHEADLEQHLRSHPVHEQGWGGEQHEEQGDVDRALKHAPHRLEATYTTAYVRHLPLETHAAVAEWDGDRLTVWTGTQRPFGVRARLAEELAVPDGDVRVIVPPTGSGFGGKHVGEVAVEAARLARAAGRPVRVRWSGQQELAWSYVRPAAVIDVRSGTDHDGRLRAWDFVNTNSGAAGIGLPYDVPNVRIHFQPAESPLPQGSYRALAATANAFARESHLDEVAHVLGLDPLELRVMNLADDRLIDVLRAAAESAGWAGRGMLSNGDGMGLALGFEKGGRVATVAEARVDPDGIVTVARLVTAYDCGAVVSPDNLRNQIQGAVIMGLGGALWERVRFEDGRVLDASWRDIRVPRFADVPEVDVILLDRRDEPPAGGGETPIIAVAPAIANAVFAATGRRIRSMPLADRAGRINA